ncbi:MAG: SIS domain-containing protein [Sphingomicrobium sp.]
MIEASAASRMVTEARQSLEVAERQQQHTELFLNAARAIREMEPRLVITCARGSSDHAATYAKFLVETETGTPVASHSPSISSVYATQWRRLDRTLFLAISQSGRSPDLIESVRAARAAGALVVALVNETSSPLSDASSMTVPVLAGPEESVAATKSYIGTLLALARVVAEWTGREPLREALDSSPQALRRAWDLDWSASTDALRDASSIYVLGRGPTFGIAQEAALKFKETCGIHAEAFSAAEVRHGPMAIINKGFPVLLLVPDDAGRDSFASLAAELVERGARVLVTGLRVDGAINLPSVPDLHPAIAPIASILSFYRMAAALSIARGRDPDAPPYLRKVTETR